MERSVRARKTQTGIRQDQIAKAALEIVAQRGLGGLSIAVVARRVGLVPSGVYRHFRGKEGILDAMRKYIHQRLGANLQQVAALGGGSTARLKALFTRHMDLIRSHEAIPRVVFSEDVFGGRPRRREALYRGIRQYLDGVADIIRHGQGDGDIRGDVEASHLAVMFLGLVQPAAILHSLGRGSFDLVSHARTAWPLFEEMLRGGAGKRRNGGKTT
jgi:AcrR family transcriptional regulator